ncbi:MAG: hypothetical protein QXV69_08870 [Sulfolobaceae archaeon]
MDEKFEGKVISQQKYLAEDILIINNIKRFSLPYTFSWFLILLGIIGSDIAIVTFPNPIVYIPLLDFSVPLASLLLFIVAIIGFLIGFLSLYMLYSASEVSRRVFRTGSNVLIKLSLPSPIITLIGFLVLITVSLKGISPPPIAIQQASLIIIILGIVIFILGILQGIVTIFRLGKRYNSSLLKISSILLVIPIIGGPLLNLACSHLLSELKKDLCLS